MPGIHACVVALIALPALSLAAPATPDTTCGGWPLWTQFESRFISPDGRVIDPASPRQHSVSEGQAYALFFALVGDDRHGFERVLRWTENNLAQGDLSRNLPAWQWGRRDDGRWDVLDPNPAADADLWMTYVLAEAGEQWNERRYRVLAQHLGRRVQQEEVSDLPGLGPVLLPAPVGFQVGPRRWRLNPSYTPVQLLRGLQRLQPELDWQRMLPGSARLLLQAAPTGFAPDWVEYDAREGFLPDQKSGAVGSYDAIRVYLWAGLLNDADPLRLPLLTHYRAMAERTRDAGVPPERVFVQDGRGEGRGNAGFTAALLPFLAALKMPDVYRTLQERLALKPPAAEAYYAQALRLFSIGATEGRYRFDPHGRLERLRIDTCESSSHSPAR